MLAQALSRRLALMHVRSQQLAQHVMVPRSAGAGARGSLTNPSSVARSFVSTVKGQGTHQQALQALAKRWTPAVRSWTNLQTVQQVYLNSRLRGVATKSFVPTAPPPSASSRAHLQSILKDRCLSTATMTASSAAGRGALATSAAATATFSSPWVTSETARRLVSGWVFGCSAWVFSMVVLGGVTRLTRSGLSMTDWKFTGERWPATQQEWQHEFDKYKASPEFRLAHSWMKLDDFKFIFFMEYAHRMWGRGLGFAFAIPMTYFLATRSLKFPLVVRLCTLFTMGGMQGFVGWWMVKSGLEEPSTTHQTPRVSPYRLAAHLTSAFVIYTGLLWTALSVANPVALADQLASSANELGAKVAQQQIEALKVIRRRVHPLAALVAVTAVSGAFVAGLEAGRAYNTFPLMDGRLVPGTDLLLTMEPWYRNLFENTATVQFDHRLLAVSTLLGVATLWASCRGLPLPKSTRMAVDALMLMAVTQVGLGISTLLNYVPVSLGSLHQAGALTLFSIVVVLMHGVRKPTLAMAAGARTVNKLL